MRIEYPIFSFFKFYYYLITNNPKKFKEATTYPNNLIIFMTPLILFLLFCIISPIIYPAFFPPVMFLWIPVILGNFAISNMVSDKWHKMERERIEKERAEKAKRDRERRAREHYKRWEEWNDFVERLKREEQRKSYYNQDGYQYNYNHSNNQNRTNSDTNMKNAIKLLGLKEGFKQEDVKKAYRKLSKVHHPDVGGLEANFKKLNKAYEYVMARI